MSKSSFRAFLLAAVAAGFIVPVTGGFSAAQAQQPTASSPVAASPANANPVVAKVDGTEIHRSDLEALVPLLPPQVRNMPLESIYDALLEQVINSKLIQAAGYKAGLQNSDAVKADLKEAEGRAVQRQYVKTKLDEMLTKDALDNAYKAYVAQHPAEEEVKAAHILLDSEDAAKAVIAELKKGGDFAKLAKDKSKDRGAAEQGGDLGYFTKEMMVEPFAKAAFDMKAGEISKAPVQTQFGWHVIKVEDRRTKPAPTRQEAEPELRQQLAEDMIGALVADARKAAKVETFQIDGSPRPAAPAAPAK